MLITDTITITYNRKAIKLTCFIRYKMDLLVSLVWFLVEFKEKFEQQTTQWTKYVGQKDKQ